MATATLSRRSSRRPKSAAKVYRIAFADTRDGFAPRHTLDWPKELMAYNEFPDGGREYHDRRYALAAAAALNQCPEDHDWAVVVEIGQQSDAWYSVQVGSYEDSAGTTRTVASSTGEMVVHMTRDVRLIRPTADEIKRHATPVAGA
jgi:hypothetical protein